MKNRHFFLWALFFTASFQLEAQPALAPCGNTDYYSPWLRAYLQNGSSVARSSDVLFIPLQIHVVGTDLGTGYLSKETVLRSFCTLNGDFTDSGIQFFLANDINYINNSSYYEHDFAGGYEMMSQYNASNAINCYIVSSPAGNCGYFSPAVDGIALAKSCTQPNDHTWAHEVGHFLSLPHPFYGWEWADELNFDEPAPLQVGGINVEKTDGSNCYDSADGFCDTPADYLNYRWSCTSEGFSSRAQLDPDSIEFISDGSFFMSYSNRSCKGRFSGEQIDAMRANIEINRTNLITTPPNEDDIIIPVSTDLSVLSPAEGTLVEAASVLLEWTPIPNATRYIVQINPFPIFSIIFNEFIVEEPYLNFTNLISDETFFWRIRPYNPYFSCNDFTSPTSFNTGTIVSVFELKQGESFRLFPNPSHGGTIWMEINSLSSADAHWEITDIAGRLIQQGNEYLTTGTQQFSLDTSQLTGGIYIASLRLGDRKVFRKFIVNEN